jgi:hypothetical protein
MHSIHFVGRMILCGEIRFDGFVYYRDKADDVAEWDVGSRTDVVGFVFLQRGVAKGDLLLIVEPVLIVGAEAGVDDPLLESQIALGEVVWSDLRVRCRPGGDSADLLL